MKMEIFPKAHREWEFLMRKKSSYRVLSAFFSVVPAVVSEYVKAISMQPPGSPCPLVLPRTHRPL